MSRIKSRNTSPEIKVFRFLWRERIHFLKHYKATLGAPDIAIPRKKRAVFIDGDFWHGWKFKQCRDRLPESYWQPKIENNIRRDRTTRTKLKTMGWKVLRIWEHELEKKPETAFAKIKTFLTKPKN